MSKCIEHREFIPVAEVPAEIPEGIAAKYYVRWPGDFHEITRTTRRATTWTWRLTGPSTT